MKILGYIVMFILGGNLSVFLYALILVNRENKEIKQYKEIIEKQRIEKELLKLELSEIEDAEIKQLFTKRR